MGEKNINLKTKNSQGDIVALYPTTKQENVIGLTDTLDTKQDIIDDLDVIRIGANMGTTALQKHQDISNKADKGTTLAEYGIEDAYTKQEIDTKISTVFSYRGSVDTFEDLPTENEVGDVYEVADEKSTYSWNGTEWSILGATVDVSNKADKGETLADYGITDAYTREELSVLINNNNPIIEDNKSYLVKGATAFYNYKEISLNLYLMERDAEGFHALNPMGGSGLFATNNTEDTITIILKVTNYANYTLGNYKFGYANGDASPSDINYALAGSDVVLSGTGAISNGNELTIPIVIPAGKRGFLINTAWEPNTSNGPLEITECYTNDVFSVSETFQGMTIKTEALVPTPMILTQEEYDAIEPKKNTVMYYIIEE